MFKKVLELFGSNAIKDIGGVIDGLSTSDDEKSSAKAKLSEIVLTSLNSMAQTQASVIQTEMKGNFLQRSWRPIMMLTFGFILVCKWFGWTDPNIDISLEQQLLEIVKYGLSGYIVGRSVEKIADNVTKNIDIPFLKKKDRGI